jgi:hypothetical protein
MAGIKRDGSGNRRVLGYSVLHQCIHVKKTFAAVVPFYLRSKNGEKLRLFRDCSKNFLVDESIFKIQSRSLLIGGPLRAAPRCSHKSSRRNGTDHFTTNNLYLRPDYIPATEGNSILISVPFLLSRVSDPLNWCCTNVLISLSPRLFVLLISKFSCNPTPSSRTVILILSFSCNAEISMLPCFRPLKACL